MTNDLLYQLALTQVPQIGCVHAKLLIQHFHSAEAIFKARAAELEKIEGIGSLLYRSIKTIQAFAEAEKEIVLKFAQCAFSDPNAFENKLYEAELGAVAHEFSIWRVWKCFLC